MYLLPYTIAIILVIFVASSLSHTLKGLSLKSFILSHYKKERARYNQRVSKATKKSAPSTSRKNKSYPNFRKRPPKASGKININHPDKILVRKAVSYIIDDEEIVKQILSGNIWQVEDPIKERWYNLLRSGLLDLIHEGSNKEPLTSLTQCPEIILEAILDRETKEKIVSTEKSRYYSGKNSPISPSELKEILIESGHNDKIDLIGQKKAYE